MTNTFSLEQFILLCPVAFQLHKNHAAFHQTENKGQSLRDTNVQALPNSHTFGPLANDSTAFQDSSESSTSSPQLPAPENVNARFNAATSSRNNIFRYYPSPPVSNLIDPQLKVTCGVCGKQCLAKNLGTHLLEIHDPYKNQHFCGVCGKSYLRSRDLKKHRKDKHPFEGAGNDRHVCGICGTSFRDHRSLRTHRKALQCTLFW